MAYMEIHEEYARRSSPQNRPTNSPQAIDGQNGKQKRAVSSPRLPPGKRRRTQASRAHVGTSSNSPSNIEKNINDHRGPSNRLENAASTPGSNMAQFHPPETVNIPPTNSSLQIPMDAGPQATPDFNGMNMDSYNNAYQYQAPICPTPPATFARFIETDPASQPAAESTSEQPWHPAPFASFIETDPATLVPQPSAESTSQPTTSELPWYPAAFASFIETNPPAAESTSQPTLASCYVSTFYVTTLEKT
ncbi:hypothetical protein EMCG_06912 [[Emmonsia] crescens]|uniref:Uncharacterized protein n=1 Tax=[Emmonsia] crescens TaxID=73230 RepID=A0A0G2JBG1_9EURO|nr:hypothetical protein EMCG_06912 [Emmonsia crescens UAMH 3008]